MKIDGKIERSYKKEHAGNYFFAKIKDLKGRNSQFGGKMGCFFGIGIFSYQGLIIWPNVTNTISDDFLPHHLVFYVIF